MKWFEKIELFASLKFITFPATLKILLSNAFFDFTGFETSIST
jgi:hypothetical protein